MATWQHINASDFIPPPIKPLVKTAAGIASALSTLLDFMQSILDVVSAFIINVVDPAKAIVQALIEEILAFIHDLRSIGIYLLLVKPNSVDDVQSTGQHLSIIADAIQDPFDPNAPDISSYGSAYCVSLLIGSPSGKEFGDSLEALGRVFNIDEFISTAENYRLYWDKSIDDIDIPNPSGGQKPDFIAIKPEKLFPPFGGIINALEKFSKMIEPGLAAASSILAMADVIKQKIDDLKRVADILDEDLTQWINNLSQLGLYILKGYVGGGTKGLANFMLHSAGAPTFEEGYLASLTIIGSPGIAGPLSHFF